MEALRTRSKPMKQLKRELKGMASKARSQIVKDYVAFPLLSATVAAGGAVVSGRGRAGAVEAGKRAFRTTMAADFSANVLRNVWAYMIIFCGHFPDQTYTFSEEEVEGETRGSFYVRQLLGAANIEGSPLFHVLSGNLGYQVEHHLYPDMPSTRYGEIAPRVRAICEKYELPYNTGPLFAQLGAVQRTILRLALPGGRPRPKPGPYRGPATPEPVA
jgi:linoleoyl-CoA desaturase